MLNLSIPVLTQVVDQALQAAADHPRWLNAINRAVAELVSAPYITRQDGHLLIASSSSNNIYSANGVCQCAAYTGIDPKTDTRVHSGGQPCWHRAAARLVRLHDEQIERQAQAAELADRVVRIVAQCAETPAQRYERALAEINELYA
jgi:hypothetical protein